MSASSKVILMSEEELQEFVDKRVRDALIRAQFHKAEYSLVTEEQVMAALHLSRTTLWRLRNQGEFPEPIKMGRLNMYRMVDLVSAINREYNKPKPIKR